MFQEPFFLHPPGARPRDGLYINPMSSSFQPSPTRLHGTKDPTSSSPAIASGNSGNGNGNGNCANGSESFYLHSPHDLVYTRITHLFDEGAGPGLQIERARTSSASSRSSGERKDETLTVKVDVHINNGTFKPPPPPPPPMGNGSASSLRSEVAKDSGSEHAYEQICIRQDEQAGSPKLYAASHKKLAATDNASDASRSRKADRRYSRSSTASESSNMSSEVHCYSSTTSTPSLSRNSSNERISKSPKVPETLSDEFSERKNSTTSATRAESEKETKTAAITGPSIFRPPPPPPPPPPEIDEVVIVTSKVVESTVKEEKRDGSHSTTQEQKCEATITTISAANKDSGIAATSCCSAGSGYGGESAEVAVGSSQPAAIGNDDEDADYEYEEDEPAPQCPHRRASAGSANSNSARGTSTTTTTTTTTTACQVTAHLVNRHMVLPFIPPKFASQAADSDTLLKPSEYLRSICKGATPGSNSSLSKARSLDNLDCQGRGGSSSISSSSSSSSSEEETRKSESEEQEQQPKLRDPSSGPPPPPLPPPPMNGGSTLLLSTNSSADNEPTTRQSQQQQQQLQQPLATISIQDLTSVQLRRTNIKMHATKTFSAPPNRSVSMTNVSEAFFVQKTDLIAELKKTKDIPGIKKMKVQRAQVEKSQEQNLISEISKAFSISNFVDQIPEKDSSGNVIPIWKRQMLARKAAERAKKELEEQIARENEEKRQKAIPPWKRQLLAKKDCDVKTTGPALSQSSAPAPAVVPPKIEVPTIPKKDPVLEISPPPPPAIPALATPTSKPTPPEETKPTVVQQHEEKRNDASDDTDSVHIIPWRAQLRKTNSKLNILD